MHKIKKNIIIFLLIISIFTFFSSFTFLKEKEQSFIVMLDPGHGGFDSGAVGYENIKEKDINLSIALITKLIITQYDKNIKVILTRDKDVFRSLQQRTDLARAINPDLFVSIHCDGSTNRKNSGIGIFLQKSNNNGLYQVKNYKAALKFGLILEANLHNKLGLKTRGIQFENYHVLRNTLKYCPSILLESGFITNKEEAKYFIEKGKKGISYSLGKSIIDYKNKINDR